MSKFAVRSRTVALFAVGLALSQISDAASTYRPLVMGKRAVVAAGHPLVAEAGLRILTREETPSTRASRPYSRPPWWRWTGLAWAANAPC